MPAEATSSTGNAGIEAREAALDVFRTVVRRRQPLDIALSTERRFGELPTRDRAFARRLVTITLRRLGQLDAVLAQLLDRPLPAKAALVQDLLRLGAAQLLFADVPLHAAVDTAVEIARRRNASPFAKLVNAVLRRISREGAALVEDDDAPHLNTPAWLWQSWEQAYGAETARSIAAAHLRDPPLDLIVKKPAEMPHWARETGSVELAVGSLRRAAGGLVSDIPGFSEGAWWVQDAAAALPVRLFGDVHGRRVADLAAAPGGKTAQLAAAGAEVTAVDISAKRLRLVAENLARLGLAAEMIAVDASKWDTQERFDAVLLDAPCTATGTIRRHPDVAWLKTKADVSRLVSRQDRLLDAAFRLTRPGGLLVYACCSLQAEEGPDRISAFLERNGDVERVPVSAEEVAGLSELLTSEGDLRTLPCHLETEGGLDGFYAARLRRRAD